MDGFLTTEETDAFLGKLYSFLNKEFQDRKEYHRTVHVAERAVLQEITVSCMFKLHFTLLHVVLVCLLRNPCMCICLYIQKL